MITAESPFKAAPRITRQDFKTIIERDAAPGVSAERDPVQYWDVIQATGVDPLFLLAMFNHESTLGQFGMARQTFSWGNTRPPSFGVPQLGVINNFSSYRDWLDGCKSTAARLVDPAWVYSHRTSIHSIFDDPSGEVWAPAGDNNDPTGYLRAVLDFMNAHASPGVPSDAPQGPSRATKPAMVAVPGITNMDGYAGTRRVEAVVLHVTDDDNVQGTLAWFKNPVSKASANAVVDFDGTIYECVPKEHSAWTNGVVAEPDTSNPLIVKWINEGVSFSTRTYTIERVGKRNTDPTEAQSQSIAKIIAWVAADEGFPIDRTHVLGHNQIDSVNRSYCPSLTERDWAHILDIARGGAGVPPAPAETARTFLDVGIPWKLVLGFRGYFQKLEEAGVVYQTLGYPTSNEFSWTEATGTARSAQRFERGWLLYVSEAVAPWDVICAPLSSHAELEARLANEAATSG